MTKKMRHLLTLLTTVFFLGACSSVKVSTDYDLNSDFSNLRTYSWHTNDVASALNHTKAISKLMDTRIRSAMDSRLESQGFSKVTKTPDFIVNYSVTAKDKMDVRTYNVYGGYAPGWGWGRGFGYPGLNNQFETVVSEYTSGTLVIDIIDIKNNHIIWRGLASKRLPSSLNPEKMDELVNKVVGNILENFPPQ